MARRANGVAQLKKIIALAQAALTAVEAQSKGKSSTAGREAKKSTSAKKSSGKRVRRSGADLVAFRKMLKAERAKGVPVADLAKKHNVSAVYIYTLK